MEACWVRAIFVSHISDSFLTPWNALKSYGTPLWRKQIIDFLKLTVGLTVERDHLSGDTGQGSRAGEPESSGRLHRLLNALLLIMKLYDQRIALFCLNRHSLSFTALHDLLRTPHLALYTYPLP